MIVLLGRKIAICSYRLKEPARLALNFKVRPPPRWQGLISNKQGSDESQRLHALLSPRQKDSIWEARCYFNLEGQTLDEGSTSPSSEGKTKPFVYQVVEDAEWYRSSSCLKRLTAELCLSVYLCMYSIYLSIYQATSSASFLFSLPYLKHRENSNVESSNFTCHP